MADYPTCQSASKFNSLFEKIGTSYRPPRVDKKWLSQQGFTGTNDKGLLKVLVFLGIIESSGTPTEIWNGVRNDTPNELSKLLKKAYSELYSINPMAHNASTEDLENFFRATTDKSKATWKRMVVNFKSLAAIANFNDEEISPGLEEIVKDPIATNIPEKTAAIRTVNQPIGSTQQQELTINLNIQLALPESTDAELLDRLFSSMHKHLMIK